MKKVIKTLLLILWLGIIFYFSSQNGTTSSNLSNGLLRKIAELLKVSNVEDFISKYGLLIRKVAHFLEYFVLAVLLEWCFKDYTKSNTVIVSIILCFIYAISDELHQLYISDRVFSFTDVLIDSIGATIGSFLFHLIYKKCCQEKKQ